MLSLIMIGFRLASTIRPIKVQKVWYSRRSTMPTLQKEIKLTNSERDVFDVLQKTSVHFDLGVTLRCAGGWVRDKLLGHHSDDIDIAIDTMLGATFAQKVNEYLSLHGEAVQKVALIETNPEQSKHLETARIKIHDLQIDLVNLRSETYTQHSRVPQMDFGTAIEDAYRRDLTINSMFYNITDAAVEDLTENGMEDLRSGVIRTPLPPLETFLDDPLRVLRAVRFAARFSFQLDEELKQSARNEVVIEALQKKISRERIGTEVDGMFKGPDPVQAIEHLLELNLFSSVFLLPHNLNFPNYGVSSVATIRAAVKILHLRTPQIQLTPEERRLYLLAALLVPIQLAKGPHETGKGKRSFCSASSHVIWEGLKWRMKDGQDVERLHRSVPELIHIYTQTFPSGSNGVDEFSTNKRVQLGLWVRQMKSLWKLGVLLGPIFTMMESFPLGIDKVDYSLRDFVVCFNKDVESEDELTSKRVVFCKELETFIEDHDVADCWNTKPLMDGKMVMEELGMKKGGPVLGQMLDLAFKWQLANPEGTKEQCIMYLKQSSHLNEVATCKS